MITDNNGKIFEDRRKIDRRKVKEPISIFERRNVSRRIEDKLDNKK